MYTYCRCGGRWVWWKKKRAENRIMLMFRSTSVSVVRWCRGDGVHGVTSEVKVTRKRSELFITSAGLRDNDSEFSAIDRLVTPLCGDISINRSCAVRKIHFPIKSWDFMNKCSFMLKSWNFSEEPPLDPAKTTALISARPEIIANPAANSTANYERTFDPIWLPHWPTCKCTISLMVISFLFQTSPHRFRLHNRQKYWYD